MQLNLRQESSGQSCAQTVDRSPVDITLCEMPQILVSVLSYEIYCSESLSAHVN
jgi:hypothetical protein